MSVVPTDQNVSRKVFLEISDNQRLLKQPSIDGYEHMILHLSELGYTDSEGRGLSYSEINNYCELSGVVLSSWEAITLKTMSDEFAVQFAKKDINEETPYKVER